MDLYREATLRPRVRGDRGVVHFMIDFSLTLFTGIGHAQSFDAMVWRTASALLPPWW